MALLFDDNSLSIGNTPMVRINKMAAGKKARIYAKIEGRNPSYSVKCRIGANLIWDAEKKGLIRPGVSEIIEPTSGNTGIALAFVCSARGYKVHLTMPDTMSIERRKVLAALGANLILTPGEKGMKGAVDKADEIAKSDKRFFLAGQFTNPANPEIHYKTTGPEIWDALGGNIDVFVAGVGTGGTITGVSRFFKKAKKRAVVSVAVEPLESPLLTQKRAGLALKPAPHKIQGIGANFIPEILDFDILDRIEMIDGATAIETARRLAKEEGILSGISSGAATAAALRLASLDEFAGKNIVVILPDSGERYLSGPLFEGLFDEKGIAK